MASSNSTSKKSSSRIRWQWNAAANPFSGSPQWKSYSDIETLIIEDAYSAGQTHAILDQYSIDFKHKIQILNVDGNKQRPVRRCNSDEAPVREERFTFILINPNRPFGGLYGWISPFIRETTKQLGITREELPSKDASKISMIVVKAAAGIVRESKLLGRQLEGERIAKMLLEKKRAGMREVWKCCAHLYSMETFLYKRINEVMRLIGDEEHEKEWRSKISTWGPFCLLLWDNPFDDKSVERGTILYRGAKLDSKLIALFKEDCSKKEKPLRSFTAFTSCSRNRAKAEPFGNVLFVMNVIHAFTIDLQPFSEYPDEEEELLSPGVCFTVDRVEFNTSKNKHVIYLDLKQKFSQTDRHNVDEGFVGDGKDPRFRDSINPRYHYDPLYYDNPGLDDLCKDLPPLEDDADDTRRCNYYERAAYRRTGEDWDWC